MAGTIGFANAKGGGVPLPPNNSGSCETSELFSTHARSAWPVGVLLKESSYYLLKIGKEKTRRETGSVMGFERTTNQIGEKAGQGSRLLSYQTPVQGLLPGSDTICSPDDNAWRQNYEAVLSTSGPCLFLPLLSSETT